MDGADDASPSDASAVDHVPAVRKGNGKGRPKGKAKARPRIDIDDQIEEANRVALMMRKLATAAKSMQKNGKMVKQRLMKKAGKLSAADLERIAVLKRCGLFTGVVECDVPDAPSLASDGEMQVSLARSMINMKMKDVMGKIPGASVMFGSAGGAGALHHPGVSSSSSSRLAAAADCPPGGVVVPARRLPSAARVEASSSASGAAAQNCVSSSKSLVVASDDASDDGEDDTQAALHH